MPGLRVAPPTGFGRPCLRRHVPPPTATKTPTRPNETQEEITRKILIGPAALFGAAELVMACSLLLTEDLKKIDDVPTLSLHGDGDQTVPDPGRALKSSTIVPNATFNIYPARHTG